MLRWPMRSRRPPVAVEALWPRRWPPRRHHATASTSLADSIADITPERIRNFCIIAHVDHGKSTLADRLMDMTGAVQGAQAQAQLLDTLEVERSRGITVKAQTVSLVHRDLASGETYLLNLIDTPGHVDFGYEVSRSIAACQGALLLVDATKGVQAQTVANFYLAFEQDLTIVPVVNKVDLDHADVDGTLAQLHDAFGIETAETLAISAKTGLGCADLLQAVVDKMPPPAATADAPLQVCVSGRAAAPRGRADARVAEGAKARVAEGDEARGRSGALPRPMAVPSPSDAARPSSQVLLFDSWFDEFRGVLCLVEVLGGTLRLGAEASRRPCTCTHAHMHTCTHAHMHTCTHAHMHTCTCTCT